MEGDLRIVGAGLHRQVAAGAGLDQLIAVEARQIDQRLGPLRRQAEAVLAVLDEQAGAEAEGQGQPRRRQAERLAGIAGRHRRVRRRAARRSPRRPCGRRRRSSARSSATTSPGFVGDQVERGEVGVVLLRRQDAALVLAPERLGRRPDRPCPAG